MKNRNSIFKVMLTAALVAWLPYVAGINAHAQTTLPTELQEVARLSQQHIGDDVIINYVKNSGKTYKLSADDIIALNSQGVSQNVIAMLQTGTAAIPSSTAQPQPSAISSPLPPPVDAPPSALPPGAPVAVSASPTLDYFQAQLTPYGNWVDMPGYGLCWQPAVDLGWRPYYDEGHWEYTDAGWYWQSDYPWGDIAFHYGRWAYTPSGWIWVPGYEFAPAWVVWRHADADGYVGWAALPPGAMFVGGAWEFNHVRVGVDFNFGLGLNFFTFVSYDHFWEHDFRHFIVPRDRLELVYRHSLIENHYRLDHGRFIDEGLARERMAALTHHEVRVAAVRDLREREEHRNAMARKDDIHDFKHGDKPNPKGFTEGREGFNSNNRNQQFKTPPGRNQENSKESGSKGNSQNEGGRENNNSK